MKHELNEYWFLYKVMIWVPIKDVISNNITEFHTTEKGFKYKYDPNEYVQIAISREEFIKLEDTLNNK